MKLNNIISSLEVINTFGERLENILKGNFKANEVIIFVHGFGVDLHETGGLFDYEANELGNRYITLQFSLSGCGNSGGKSEDMNYRKHADDLSTVINAVKTRYPDKNINIITHSMGGFVTAVLSPNNIKKIILVGLPNHNISYLKQRLIDRFKNREGSVIDLDGISIFPRSSGINQKIGSSFWKEINRIQPIALVEDLSKKTMLKIIHMRQDEIIGNLYINDYHNLPNIEAVYIDGNHSVTDIGPRKELINEINYFFNEA